MFGISQFESPKGGSSFVRWHESGKTATLSVRRAACAKRKTVQGYAFRRSDKNRNRQSERETETDKARRRAASALCYLAAVYSCGGQMLRWKRLWYQPASSRRQKPRQCILRGINFPSTCFFFAFRLSHLYKFVTFCYSDLVEGIINRLVDPR